MKNSLMNVGTGIQLPADTWNFADAVKSFDEHIAQSVPHCQEQRDYVAALSRFFLHENARIIEIGVSTGRTALAILDRVSGRSITYQGIDVEPGMVATAQRNLADDPRFSASVADAVGFDFASCALVVSYYTLQFIPRRERRTLLRRIFAALEPGGAFILYEKTLAGTARAQDAVDQLYREFKAGQGLTAEEIFMKARSLQGVADPLTVEGNRDELLAAGFADVELIFRSHCFAGFLALKS